MRHSVQQGKKAHLRRPAPAGREFWRRVQADSTVDGRPPTVSPGCPRVMLQRGPAIAVARRGSLVPTACGARLQGCRRGGQPSMKRCSAARSSPGWRRLLSFGVAVFQRRDGFSMYCGHTGINVWPSLPAPGHRTQPGANVQPCSI